MLKLPQPYSSQIEQAKIKIIENEDQYKFVNISSYWYSSFLKLPDSDWEEIVRVSFAEDKVFGFFKATVDREVNQITSLTIINFNLKTISFTFIKDLENFVRYLIEYKKFNKISFSVVVGNPAERMYDKFTEKYNGRVVGIKKNEVKLVDGKFYDLKLYEIENNI